MTTEEREMLENAKIAYLKIIKYVKRLELEKAKTYLKKKKAGRGLCSFLFYNQIHYYDTYSFIYHEMERIGRIKDYKINNYPNRTVNKEELTERLQYRIDLISEILK